MKPLCEAKTEELTSIRTLVSDVDDTITTDGRLHTAALSAMYDLRENNIPLILLSGGSAGWCETYLRQWPTNAVIAESGAVMITRDESGKISYCWNKSITEEDRLGRKELLKRINPKYLSSDQYCRLNDIAVDLSLTPQKEQIKIKEMAEALGANTATSSIHLNIWFGDYDKRKALIYFLGKSEEELKTCTAYTGDALNDEPLFSFFPLSFGVAQVEQNREKFKSLPSYCAPSRGGEGFAEIVNEIIKRRR